MGKRTSGLPGASPSNTGTSEELPFEQLAAEWLRHLRGKRSQVAFSRRLGYRSNIAYRWETGKCWPAATDALAIIDKFGLGINEGLLRFYGKPPAWATRVDPLSREGVAMFLDDLRGQSSVTDIAKRARVSRFSVSRWLSAEATPRFPEFLLMVQACSRRLLDFCAAFVDPRSIPCLEPTWEQLTAARRLAYDAPWSQAVLRALELEQYAALPHHEPGWIAALLGISPDVESACLESLRAANQVTLRDGRYAASTQPFVDTRSDPERARQLKSWWLEVARDRLSQGTPGVWAYNLFSISGPDLSRLQELHRAYFREMQRIISESSPGEHVALFCAQLFALDATSPNNPELDGG